MLDSKHDLQLENSWIFMVPKKEVPSFALAVNHGLFEDPVFGSFLNTFGERFFQKSDSSIVCWFYEKSWKRWKVTRV